MGCTGCTLSGVFLLANPACPLHGLAFGNEETRTEQAAEIERLKEENLALIQEAASGRAAWEQCTQARDDLRREVERLGAERDELKRKLDVYTTTENWVSIESLSKETSFLDVLARRAMHQRPDRRPPLPCDCPDCRGGVIRRTISYDGPDMNEVDAVLEELEKLS